MFFKPFAKSMKFFESQLFASKRESIEYLNVNEKEKRRNISLKSQHFQLSSNCLSH